MTPGRPSAVDSSSVTDARYPLTGNFLKGRLRQAMTDTEKDLIEGLISREERYLDPHTILPRGQKSDTSTLLIEGFVLRVNREGENRHIVGIQVPGDFVDLHAFALKRLDHDVVTVGATRVGYAKHGDIAGVVAKYPHLARLLWFSTLLDAAIHREWIMKMEQLNADGRVAHLIAEIWQRLDFIGMAEKSGFYLPLTQADLADACGTTAIHMNRIMRRLREDNILDMRRGRVTIPDIEKLKEYGRFSPDFLYGDGPLHVGTDLNA
jgi:CRP-like cAMP-binding protein